MTTPTHAAHPATARHPRQDEIAQLAWGVLVAAQQEGVTDLNVIAHAIAGNVLRRLRPSPAPAHRDRTGHTAATEED